MAGRLDVGFERLFNSSVDDVNVAFNALNSFELHSKQEAMVVLELTLQGECPYTTTILLTRLFKFQAC